MVIPQENYAEGRILHQSAHSFSLLRKNLRTFEILLSSLRALEVKIS